MLAVLVALEGASRSTPSSTVDLVLRSIEDQDSFVTIEGDVDLTSIAADLGQKLPDELRQDVPAVFQDRDVGVLRYRNIQAKLADVRFVVAATPEEMTVQATVLISADRERATLTFTGWRLVRQWNPDGSADVAVVEISGAVAVTPNGGAALKARALLDQISIRSRLHLFDKMVLKVSLDHRQVGSHSFDVAPPAYVPAGTSITSFGVLAIQNDRARVRVGLALPPTNAGTPDAGVLDAGPPNAVAAPR